MKNQRIINKGTKVCIKILLIKNLKKVQISNKIMIINMAKHNQLNLAKIKHKFYNRTINHYNSNKLIKITKN